MNPLNTKKVFVAVLVIALTFTAITAFAQSAKEAVMGLKKLQARCQSGIAYRDYSNAVADAKFPVNLFMESAEAKKSRALTNSMDIVMRHYEFAGEIWNEKISAMSKSQPSREQEWLARGFVDISSDLGIEISRRCPGLTITGGTHYAIDLALPNIWGQASEELEKTTKLYAKPERRLKK